MSKLKTLVICCIILSIVVSSCVPSASSVEKNNESIVDPLMATQTRAAEIQNRVEATLAAKMPTELEVQDEGNKYFEEHGVAVISTNSAEYAAVAVHRDGEILAAMTDTDSAGNITDVEGGVYINPEGQSAVVYAGEDGLPSKLVFENYTLVYENYTDDTVDVAIIFPDGTIEVKRSVPIEYDDLQEIRSRMAMLNQRCGGVLCSMVLTEDYLDPHAALELASLIVGVAVCAAGLITAPHLSVFLIAGCAGVLLNIIKHFIPEDNEVIQESVAALESFACTGAFINFGEIGHCISLVVDLAATVVSYSDDLLEKQETAVNLGEASLVYGGGSIQITLSWDNQSDIDLWVTDPYGEKIYFEHPSSNSGGQLDVDDTDGYGPENIFWPIGQAPEGHYEVSVDYYSGYGIANYQVLVQLNGEVYNFYGALNDGETHSVYSFSFMP